MNHQNDLLRAFEPVATETWHRAIERFLKGKPLEHLDWKLEEQLTISPLRRRSNSPAQSLALERSDNSWHIAEQWTLDTPSQLADTKKSILHALQKGVNALVLDWHWLPSQQELAEVLDGVELAYVWVHLQLPTADASAVLERLQGLPQAAAWRGSAALSAPASGGDLRAALQAADALPQQRSLTWRIAQPDSQHLAQSLYQASQWMDEGLAMGYTPTQIVAQIRFEIALPAHYFTAIAYLRAARRLWLALLEAYEAPEAVQPWWHAYTVNPDGADPYRNMLVGTTQALSAVVGGVDSLLVTPANAFDTEVFAPARRMARNVQHLLQAESYLDRVVDPAAGAYYIEHMTERIAERAWQQFCTL